MNNMNKKAAALGHLSLMLATIIIFIIMLIYFISAVFFASPAKASADVVNGGAALNSGSLMSIFLTDSVSINGETKKVREALSEVYDGILTQKIPEEQAGTFLKPIEDLFSRKYSCNGKNELILIVFDGDWYRDIYLDYPRHQWARGGEGLVISLNIALEEDVQKYPYLVDFYKVHFKTQEVELTRLGDYSVFRIDPRNKAHLIMKGGIVC